MEKAGRLFELVKSNWNDEEKQKNLKRKLDELTAIEKDINIQLETVESSSSNKKPKNEVANWLANVEKVKHEIQNLEAGMEANRWRSKLWGVRVKSLTDEIVDLIGKSRFQGELVLEAPDNKAKPLLATKLDELSGKGRFQRELVCETKAEPLLVTKLVGEAFQVNLEKIWEWLMKDEVLRIGIYGMGGVGKTTLVTHIYNLLLERQNKFSNVYRVIVSQDFSIHKLQDRITKVINFDLCNEDEEEIRAAKLSRELDKKQKSVLILDDLWNQFSSEEIGIPMGCKLIMTTRSLDICRMMSCHEKIKLEPLLEDESLNLFIEKLGNYATLSSKVKDIAKSVVRECDGLPLGIVTLAGSMRGVEDVREWRNVLEQLKQSIIGPTEMEDEVFKVLNLSYERLRDSTLQECFLYCALFPEDWLISREELIEYLVSENIIKDLNSENIIKDLNSRQTQFDRGHTMLNKLENACLLEGSSDKDYVKMHDLIRDMAIKKMKVNPKAIIEAGKRLKEVPNVIEWSKDLVRVSLMENYIKEIRVAHSPSCPKLSTLLLFRNRNLEFIADSFFLQFCGLKVLDLSETAITVLPDSVSNLVSLTSLLLRFCERLWYIPSLATLKTLKKLDLLGCMSLEVVPEGLEFLSNLQYLDVYGTKIKDIPNGILPNLSHLQFLRLHWSIAVEVKSGCLGKVEYLECRFPKPHDFYSMMMDYPERPLLSIFKLLIGEFYLDKDRGNKDELDIRSKLVVYSGCDIGKDGDFVGIPKVGHRLDRLVILRCHTLRSLDNSFLADGTGAVVILECEGLEYLTSLSGSSSTIFDHVIKLNLGNLNNLQDLISREGAPSPSFPLGGVFSCLKWFYIWDCPSITSLFPYGLLPNLQNLKEITVAGCEKIEQIIGEESISGSHTEFISLPSLKSLKFLNLPELKSICSQKMACDSMEKMSIENCPKLKRIPLSLIQLDNGQLSPLRSLKKIKIHPAEWWDSVELDHPNAKDVLQPLLSE